MFPGTMLVQLSEGFMTKPPPEKYSARIGSCRSSFSEPTELRTRRRPKRTAVAPTRARSLMLSLSASKLSAAGSSATESGSEGAMPSLKLSKGPFAVAFRLTEITAVIMLATPLVHVPLDPSEVFRGLLRPPTVNTVGDATLLIAPRLKEDGLVRSSRARLPVYRVVVAPEALTAVRVNNASMRSFM